MYKNPLNSYKPVSRTLRGCVDWNSLVIWCASGRPRSHPSRVRGLKYIELGSTSFHIFQSHPSRVRGLKFLIYFQTKSFLLVAPFAGAWIEIFMAFASTVPLACRTLRGCVDWNKSVANKATNLDKVAPFAGAWIEILGEEVIRTWTH